MYLESNDIKHIFSWIESKLSSIKIQDSVSNQIYYINSHQQLNKSIPNLEKFVSNINSAVFMKYFPLDIKDDNTPPTEVASMLIPTYLGLLLERENYKLSSDIQKSILLSTDWLIKNQYDKKLGGMNAGGWGLSKATKNENMKAYIYTSYQAAWGLINFYEYGPQCKISYKYEIVLQSLLDCYRFFMANAKPEIKDLDSISIEKSISWPEQAGEKKTHSLATAYAIEFLYYFYKFCQKNHKRIEADLITINEDLITVDDILSEELLKVIWEKSLSPVTMDFDEELIKSTSYDLEPYSDTSGPHTSYKDTSGAACLIWICLVTQRIFPNLYDNRMKSALSEQINKLINNKKKQHITDIQYIIDAVSDFQIDLKNQSPEEKIILKVIYDEILENRLLLREILAILNTKK